MRGVLHSVFARGRTLLTIVYTSISCPSTSDSYYCMLQPLTSTHFLIIQCTVILKFFVSFASSVVLHHPQGPDSLRRGILYQYKHTASSIPGGDFRCSPLAKTFIQLPVGVRLCVTFSRPEIRRMRAFLAPNTAINPTHLSNTRIRPEMTGTRVRGCVCLFSRRGLQGS